MKTPLLVTMLLLGLQSQAAPRLCEVVFKEKLSRTDKLALEWATDEGFRALKRENVTMGGVKTYYDSALETRLYYTATGLPNNRGEVPLIDPDAKAVVVFFHGSGTAAGSGLNFVGPMNKLANVGVAGLSFDLPFHADGPKRDQFNNVEFVMDWIDKVLKPARDAGKPIFLVGHSFGPEIIGEYLYQHPFAVQGAALLSPVGFNEVLRDWEENVTQKMKFGTDVAENSLGGIWADTISKQFKWQQSGGRGDPTILNPNLRVEILSGDREEYVPGPIKGRARTLSGKNTYDLGAAIRPFFKNANITIEPGVGHMIFNQRDSQDREIVSRTLFHLLGFDIRHEGQMAQDLTEKRNGRPAWVQLEAMLAQDHFFQAWLAATHQTGLAQGLIRKANNEQALMLLKNFREALKARST